MNTKKSRKSMREGRVRKKGRVGRVKKQEGWEYHEEWKKQKK